MRTEEIVAAIMAERQRLAIAYINAHNVSRIVHDAFRAGFDAGIRAIDNATEPAPIRCDCERCAPNQ